MQNGFDKAPAPCIVNEGILINRTDIIRALETLESVKYSFVIDGNEISQGEGVVVKVFASPDTSTLAVNGCLFLNVLSFNYLRFFTNNNNTTTMELVEDTKTLRLVSLEEEGRRNNLANRDLFAARDYDEETHAEMFDDTDDDDRY